MYKPTVAVVIGKREYGDDWEFAFRSHTGKYFSERFPWESGIDWKIGDYVFFNGRRAINDQKEEVLKEYEKVTGKTLTL